MGATSAMTPEDKEESLALESLIALLDEQIDSDNESNPEPVRRPSNLQIKSKKMPPLHKHHWISVFLGTTLIKINWTQRGPDNLSSQDRWALSELEHADDLIVKSSDKGGNVVLMSADMYEREVAAE